MVNMKQKHLERLLLAGCMIHKALHLNVSRWAKLQPEQSFLVAVITPIFGQVFIFLEGFI